MEVDVDVESKFFILNNVSVNKWKINLKKKVLCVCVLIRL